MTLQIHVADSALCLHTCDSLSGASIPLRQLCISDLCVRFTPYLRIFTQFILVIDSSVEFPPLFSLFHYISTFPLVSGKLLLPRHFFKFPSNFVTFLCILHTFCVFRFHPTLTMMHLLHHTMHV